MDNSVKRSSSVNSNNSTSNYTQINANVHARVKAFQEQRQLKRSGSISSNKSQESIQQVINKPLPPLPSNHTMDQAPMSCHGDPISKDRIIDKDNDGHVLSNTKIETSSNKTSHLHPIRQAPKAPPGIITEMSMERSPNLMFRFRPKKNSLSARRGLNLQPDSVLSKLKPHEFASQPLNKSNPGNNSASITNGRQSNPGSIINGIQTTLSSSNNQIDTEGTEPRHISHPNGLFANFSKYVDSKSGSLNFAGKLSLSSKGIDFSNGSSFRITLDELEFLEQLGHGNYGNVSKVLHKPTNIIMAMKEVRLELDESKFRQILMELEVLHKCQSPYIVDFYGAFFIEGAVYMCMEYMDGGSLDKSYDQLSMGGIDEPQLAFIANAVIRGLKELKDVHNIMHRDVKPTNILCSAKQGTVKLCDFGVSGNLVASLAKTNIGCQSYMAPERIKSLNPDKATYTVQSDIWSLGLSILEMALGAYPYPPEAYDNIFSQLSAIVDGPPPRLSQKRFSSEAQDFVSICLQKIPERRPTYAALLEHPWLKNSRDININMGDYITERIRKRHIWLEQTGGHDVPKNVPALHMGGL